MGLEPVINCMYDKTELLDEDDMASNDDTKGATQQSIKAYVNAQGGGGLTNAARAYLSAVQSVASGAWVQVELDAESYDIGSDFDSTTNYRFDVPADGYYLVSGSAGISVLGADKVSSLAIFKNDAVVAVGANLPVSIAASPVMTISDCLYLESGDYIDLRVYHNHGANRDVLDGSHRTSLAVVKIG